MMPELEEALKEWAGRGFPGSGATFNHLALLTDRLFPSAPEWTPATLMQCLAGDRIRIGTDETDVIRTDGGRVWHADNTDPYHPKPWKHIELRMELAANPGFQEYPPNTPCEILATPERKAALLFQTQFSGSAVASSDVD